MIGTVQEFGGFRKWIACWALVLGAMVAGLGPALGDTPVERGDVLFVSISGAPEMSRDAKVDADGRIRLPLLGGIDVAGADVDEIQRRIEAALVARDIVLSPVVLVEVSAYRPVYVGGAVKLSGEIPYQPGLTVRQAIIAAGGIDPLQGSKPIDMGQLLELLARRQAATLGLAQRDSQIARLRAQLVQDAGTAPPAPEGAADGAGMDAFARVDRALLGEMGNQRDLTRAYADAAVSAVQLELDVLSQQATLQASERDLQAKEVAKTQDMVDKGLVPLPRLIEVQRENSRLSRDLLENYAFAARARQNIELIRHQTAQTEADLRIRALEALRIELQDRAALEAEIDIINGHLLAAGPVTQVAGDPGTVTPRIVIYRRVGDTSTELGVSQETDVLPGDVIEVRLPDVARVPSDRTLP